MFGCLFSTIPYFINILYIIITDEMLLKIVKGENSDPCPKSAVE